MLMSEISLFVIIIFIIHEKAVVSGGHLGNMLIRCPDTPNHKDDFSIIFLIVKKHEMDTKFGFVAHLAQM